MTDADLEEIIQEIVKKALSVSRNDKFIECGGWIDVDIFACTLLFRNDIRFILTNSLKMHIQ